MEIQVLKVRNDIPTVLLVDNRRYILDLSDAGKKKVKGIKAHQKKQGGSK